MSKKILSDGKTTEYSYDSKGYLVSVKDSSGTMSFAYDSVGNLTKQTNANGEVIEYSYDKLGNVTLIKTPNTSTKYEYDILGRLSKVTDKNNLVTKYTYDSVGNLIKEEKGNGSYTTYEYDNLYRLKKLVNKKSNGEVISSYKWSSKTCFWQAELTQRTNVSGVSFNTTDNRGLRTKVVDNTGKTTDYTYDNAGKLIKEVVTENGKVTLTASYSYDAVGNRLTKTENNITTNYTYDKNNRLLKEGNISYTYDNAGNLIKKQSTAEITEYTLL